MPTARPQQAPSTWRVPQRARVRALTVAVSLALLFPVISVAATNPYGPSAPSEVLVAVLDTGLDPTHPEIDMTRVVAWWDFGTEGHPLPGPGDLWDPVTSTPFDDHGHGTAVASLVAGQALGAYPRVKIAVARLDNGEGGIVRTAEAMRWAASLGADVVSMSFGSLVPFRRR